MSVSFARSICIAICVVLVFVAMVVIQPNLAIAQSEDPHLPDRPDPGSLPSTSNPPSQPAWIELYTNPFQPGVWTVVQWLDGTGNWNDVPGWQGSYNQPDHVVWAVEQNNFQKGPFRWAIYQSSGGALLTVSPSFYLPAREGQILRQDVWLPTPVEQYMPQQSYFDDGDRWPTYDQYYSPRRYRQGPRYSQCSDCHQ